jgi:hypothetical protein
MSIRLELIEPSPGLFTVIVGDKFGDMLGRDEALGVIAAVLFAPEKMPAYVGTYAQWIRRTRGWREHEWAEPVALIEMRKPAPPGGAVLRGTGVFEGGGSLPTQVSCAPRGGDRVRMPAVFRKVGT